MGIEDRVAKKSRSRLVVGLLGSLTLVFGLGCLNYTKPGDSERHRQFAEKSGMPAPGVGIAHLGMLLTPLGGGLIGFIFGRKRVIPNR